MATSPTRTRVLIPVGVVAGLLTAFGVGTAVGGDDRPAPVSFEDTGSCDDLLTTYVERGAARVGPYGWDFPMAYLTRSEGLASAGDSGDSAESSGSSGGSSSRPATDRATSSAGGTNGQEAGVDEPDVVKTDGALLVRVQDGDLLIYDVSGAEVVQQGSLALDDVRDPELLLVGDTVVVTGGDAAAEEHGSAGTRVLRVDVADPVAPVVVETATYDSSLDTARLHGGTVRLVLHSGLPDLDFVEPRPWRSDDAAVERNREIVAASVIDDWLPHLSVDGGDPIPVVACDDVTVPGEDAGLGTLSVVGFDPAADTADTAGAASLAEPSATALVADTDLAYFSADHLYVAASAYSAAPCCWEGDVVTPGSTGSDPDPGTTRVHEFDLAGSTATYAASGEVEGAVADRWAMDEDDGVLRVAVGPTQATGDFNSVLTLSRVGDTLTETGRVDHLGPGEQIESVRWFDDLAIVVTFRRTDPLYAVDLTDPGAPALVGELKIPGFSEYLHPLGTHRLLGVGQGPGSTGAGARTTWGAQVGLFDVTDLADVRRLDVPGYHPGTTALAGADPRQLTWLPSRRTVLTVVAQGDLGRTGWVSVLRLADGRLGNRLVEVEHGDEVDEVRLVPLPDDRVVLVTGDGAWFFALDA